MTPAYAFGTQPFPPTATKSPPAADRAVHTRRLSPVVPRFLPIQQDRQGQAEAMRGDLTAHRDSVDPQVTNRVNAGSKAAAIQAAEPRSDAPAMLRMRPPWDAIRVKQESALTIKPVLIRLRVLL